MKRRDKTWAQNHLHHTWPIINDPSWLVNHDSWQNCPISTPSPCFFQPQGDWCWHMLASFRAPSKYPPGRWILYESWETVLSRCDILRYSGYYPWSLRQTHHHGYTSADHGDIHWWAMVFRGISTPMIPKINGIQWPWLRRVMVNASICHIMSYVNARRHLCANMRKYEHRGSVVGKCWEWYAGRFQESTCLWVCMIVWYIILFENVRKSVASQFYSILIQFRRKSEDHRCSRNLWKKIIP